MKRKEWAKDYRFKGLEWWNKVHFSGESKLAPKKNGKIFVKKYDGEDWDND